MDKFLVSENNFDKSWNTNIREEIRRKSVNNGTDVKIGICLEFIMRIKKSRKFLRTGQVKYNLIWVMFYLIFDWKINQILYNDLLETGKNISRILIKWGKKPFSFKASDVAIWRCLNSVPNSSWDRNLQTMCHLSFLFVLLRVALAIIGT